jgi:putative peptidoglycan lipid II flippase
MLKEKKNWRSYLYNIWKKYHGQLLSNMLTVGLVSLLVKGISFFKEIIIADTYGVSELLDTYLIAVLVPSFVQNVFIGSYNSVFIPNYVAEKNENKNIAAFQGSSFIITASLALLLMVITYIGIDFYLEVLFPGHETQYYQLIKVQLWVILPCMFFWAVSSLISGLLMVEDEYLHSSLQGLFVPVSTIIFLVFFHERFQEITLALGMLIGSALSLIYLLFVGFLKNVIHISKPSFESRNIKILLQQFPAKISSGLIHGLNPMVDQFYSAQLAAGAIASLNYGSKIPVVILGLISIPVGSTLLPYFSKKSLEGSKELFKNLKKVLAAGLGFGSLLAILLIVFSKLTISLFFERGTFTSSDTNQVYVIQQMYLIQIPFYISAIVMNKYLNAINKNNFLVLSSVVNLILNIILNYAFLKLMGIKGIALATSIVYLVNALIIYLYIKKTHTNKITS